MIVVDTNMIAYLYLSSGHSKQAEELLLNEPDWSAPILWRSEFRNVLAHYLRKKLLNLDDVMTILEEAEALMSGKEYELSSRQVMQLVNKSDCSAYDCEFVALARHLNVPLITADKKILREFPDDAQSLEVFLENMY
ncbi:MAG: type II toxin-antitoxin system VapC family toxin [Deltaproteobacteria bacterium]|nr:type II toxin-antitoxin system VapC family toxin [Deltaproteobacteria bacterium]